MRYLALGMVFPGSGAWSRLWRMELSIFGAGGFGLVGPNFWKGFVSRRVSL
jgi:hypothetical protein